MSEFLQIGAFARLANVTVKTLRFYADQGLLVPAHVDERTGYRYYTPAQVPVLTRILNLREAGFGLGEIIGLLERDFGAQAFGAAIAAQRQRLLRQKAEIEARLHVVEALARAVAREGIGGLEQVRLSVGEAEPAYTDRRCVEGLGDAVTDMFETAEARVGQARARSPRAPFLLFHDDGAAPDSLDLEVCIPVTDETPDALPSRVVPEPALSCSLIYAGPYDQTEVLRAQLQDWIAQAGLRPSGPMREVYHRFGANQIGYTLPARVLAKDPSAYVTEVRMGVAADDAS